MVLRSPYIERDKFGRGCKEGCFSGNSKKLMMNSGNDRQHRLKSKEQWCLGRPITQIPRSRLMDLTAKVLSIFFTAIIGF